MGVRGCTCLLTVCARAREGGREGRDREGGLGPSAERAQVSEGHVSGVRAQVRQSLLRAEQRGASGMERVACGACPHALLAKCVERARHALSPLLAVCCSRPSARSTLQTAAHATSRAQVEVGARSDGGEARSHWPARSQGEKGTGRARRCGRERQCRPGRASTSPTRTAARPSAKIVSKARLALTRTRSTSSHW